MLGDDVEGMEPLYPKAEGRKLNYCNSSDLTFKWIHSYTNGRAGV
jgi:hypothetical protein